MYLLFDVGGSNSKIAVSENGKSLAASTIIPTEPNFEHSINNLLDESLKLAGKEQAEAAVFGIAGSLDKERNTLIASPNLPSWVQQPVKESLEEGLNCPIFLENDAFLGGLGEATFGAGKDTKILAFLTIGTGVGGVKIVDKAIDKNSQGFEVGHQVIVADGKDCACGGKGHLESYIGGASIEKIYGVKPENLTDKRTWDEITKYLSIGINNTCVFWSPEMVVLGGLVSLKIPLEKVLYYLQDNLKVLPIPQITKAALGSQSGLYGGLALLSHTLSSSE